MVKTASQEFQKKKKRISIPKDIREMLKKLDPLIKEKEDEIIRLNKTNKEKCQSLHEQLSQMIMAIISHETGLLRGDWGPRFESSTDKILDMLRERKDKLLELKGELPEYEEENLKN